MQRARTFAVFALVACAEPPDATEASTTDGSTGVQPMTSAGTTPSTSGAATTTASTDASTSEAGSSDSSGGESGESDASTGPDVEPLPPCPDDVPEPTPLAALAADLEPGAWAQLDTVGFDGGVLLEPCEDGSNIVEYADNAAWDPVGRHLLFLGSSHGVCYGTRFVVFSECTNEWTIGPLPADIPEFGSVAHAYHHNTVDPATGDLYYRHYGSTTIWRFTTNGEQSWTEHSEVPLGSPGSATCCGGLQWFPEADALVYVDGGEGVWWHDAAEGWQRLANTAIEYDAALPTWAMAYYDTFIEYDPVHAIVLFGGGGESSNVWRLDADGIATPLADAPAGASLGTVNGSNTIDPVTGRLVVLEPGGGGWQLDPVANAWTDLGTPHPLAPQGYFEGAETDVPALGVSVHVVWSFGDSAVWVHKP